MIATNRIKAVIGTGITGLSVARFLAHKQQAFVLLDTRTSPPNLEKIRAEFPDVQIELGDLNTDTLLLCDEIIVSPGISVETPALVAAKNAGIPIVGDIEIFV
ncbi:MAG: UDP-N-acetylmuramoyl-L-alanine--D-glutamate ligase, partial [Moraxellaceae bacterium]